MTNKTLTRLIFLVAISLLIIFGRNTVAKYQLQQPNEYLKEIKNIKKEDLVRIEIMKSGKDLIMTKQDGKWKIASKAADLTKVNALINSLLPTLSPQLISMNKDKFAELDLASQSATTVKLISPQKETMFAIGKQIGADTAIALQGINQVFGLISVPVLSVATNDWVDKNIIDIDSLQIKQLIFQTNESYTLDQIADKQWVFNGSDEKVNSDGVNTFLYKFNPFKADDLASSDQIKQHNLLSSGFNISLIDKNEQRHDFSFRLVKDQYIVKRSTDNEYFVISQTMGEGFNKKRNGFIAIN